MTNAVSPVLEAPWRNLGGISLDYAGVSDARQDGEDENSFEVSQTRM